MTTRAALAQDAERPARIAGWPARLDRLAALWRAPRAGASAAAPPAAEPRVFWTLQIVWWLATAAIYTPLSWAGGVLRASALPYLTSYAIAIACTFVMRWAFARLRPRGMLMVALGMVGLAAGFAAVEIPAIAYVNSLATGQEMPRRVVFYLMRMLSETTYLLCWAALFVAFTEAAAAQEAKARLAQAEARAREAQLAMLSFQLNPHFLFNTLNAISALILDGRAAEAEAVVVRLSAFLRGSLDAAPLAKAPLAQELEAQGLHLAIEQTRFGDKLAVAVDAPASARACLVPRLILQPLIEDAVTASVAPSSAQAKISIVARAWSDRLVLDVVDDGAPDERAGDGPRAGAAAAARRLHAIYGDRARLEAGPRADGGYAARIDLPREEAT